MKHVKIILWVVLLVFTIFLFVYGKDNYYLKLKSADKTWSEIAVTLDEVLRKGDYLEYDTSTEQNDPSKLIYQKRFSQQVDALNQRNSPRVLNTYLLKTHFTNIEEKEIIEFELTEKSTDQLIEKRAVQIEYIKAKSIIPGIVALFGAMLTMRPILCLFAGVWIGASIGAGNSFILGLNDMLFTYLPYGLAGNNYAGFKISIFIFCMLFVLRILAKSGAVKTLSEEKTPLKFIPLVLSLLHPYLFISFGAWWWNAINKNKTTFNTEFPFQSLGVALQPLILISPFLILGLSTIRNASFALIVVSVCYILWSKKASRLVTETVPKQGLKNIRAIPYITILSALVPLPLTLVGFNPSSILMLSGLTALLCSIFCSTRFKTLSSAEILKLAGSNFVFSLKYILYVILATALGKVLYDLGAIHYMISVFSVDAESPQFYSLLFLSSLISSAFMGGCLISAPILISSFAPLMGYNISSTEISTATICILEGALMGELFCPYSPTTIISSAIYHTSLTRHVLKQLPYITLAAVVSAVVGFWFYGLGISKALSYAVIAVIITAAVFASKKHKKGKISA